MEISLLYANVKDGIIVSINFDLILFIWIKTNDTDKFC